MFARSAPVLYVNTLAVLNGVGWPVDRSVHPSKSGCQDQEAENGRREWRRDRIERKRRLGQGSGKAGSRSVGPSLARPPARSPACSTGRPVARSLARPEEGEPAERVGWGAGA